MTLLTKALLHALHYSGRLVDTIDVVKAEDEGLALGARKGTERKTFGHYSTLAAAPCVVATICPTAQEFGQISLAC